MPYDAECAVLQAEDATISLQKLSNLSVAVGYSVARRCVAVMILNVDIGVLESNKELDCVQLPCLASLMESSSAVVV